MYIIGDVRMANVSKREILSCSKIRWSKSKILFNVEKQILILFNCFMEVVTFLCYMVLFKTA